METAQDTPATTTGADHSAPDTRRGGPLRDVAMLVLGVLLTAAVQFWQTRANESAARQRDDAHALIERVSANLRMVRGEAPKEAFDLTNQAWAAFADGRYGEAADLALRAQAKAREVLPDLGVPGPV